jgi:hydroxymethylbilane synthase
MLPAIGQAVIGVECAERRGDVVELLQPLEHAPTRAALEAERALAAALGASCQAPVAGHATLAGYALRLAGLVGSADGSRILAEAVEGHARDPVALGSQLARRLLAAGAGGLL